MDKHGTANKCFCNVANLLRNACDLSTPQTIILESLLKFSQKSGNFQQALLNYRQTFPFLNILGQRSSIPSWQINTCTNGQPQTSRKIQSHFQRK